MDSSKKLLIVGIIVAVLAFGGVAWTWQSGIQIGKTNYGMPPTMPAGHETRYETLGTAGCYGCHGTNSEGEQMLKAATAMPTDHYQITEDGIELAGEHALCITCHVSGSTDE